MDLIDGRFTLWNQPVQYTLKEKSEEIKFETLLENMEFMVCASLANVPEDISLSLTSSKQCGWWSMHHTALEHYVLKARRRGVSATSLISMEILFGIVSRTSLSVSAAKPLDIERDDDSFMDLANV